MNKLLNLLAFSLTEIICLGSLPPANSISSSSDEAFWYVNPQVEWSNFPQPNVSSYFSQTERWKIWEALEKAQERINSSSVLRCIDEHTTYENYKDEKPSEAVYRLANSDVELYIDANDGKDILGQAELGRSRNVKKFKIEISKPNLGDPNYTSEDFAGTIIHEMLHQASYDHPEFSEDKSYYTTFRGNLVYEAAWCVRSAGQEDAYKSKSGSLSTESLRSNSRRWLRE